MVIEWNSSKKAGKEEQVQNPPSTNKQIKTQPNKSQTQPAVCLKKKKKKIKFLNIDIFSVRGHFKGNFIYICLYLLHIWNM